jgi:hypothetical protein
MTVKVLLTLTVDSQVNSLPYLVQPNFDRRFSDSLLRLH